MGFWQTGYKEFHEQTGVDSWPLAQPVRYGCEQCSAVFDQADELRQHRFERHPYAQPVLFVCGIQVGASPFQISEPKSPPDFVALQFGSVEINGNDIPAEKLGMLLATHTNDRVTVKLTNDAASATFELIFSVASSADLQGVERAFQRLAEGGNLDLRSIEDFIAEAEKYDTASNYADGICQYLYGALTKERAPDVHLKYDEYVEKFNQAIHTLTGFDRSIARQIRALISFHFNHFQDAELLAPNGRVGAVAARFKKLQKLGCLEATQSNKIVLEEMLADIETCRILDWALLSTADLKVKLPELEASLNTEISTFDRAKILVLLAEQLAADGEYVRARRYARELLNNASTTQWAERLIGRLPMDKLA